MVYLFLLPRLSTSYCRVCLLVAAASVYLLLPRLLLEELVAHGVEGDGQPAPEEQDEVDGQLVPGTTTKLLWFYHRQTTKEYIYNSVANAWCLSRIPDPNFFHLGSEFFYPGSEFFQSRIRIKEFRCFNPKKMVSMLSEIWSRLFIPDPGVKKVPVPGSGTLCGSLFTLCDPLNMYSA